MRSHKLTLLAFLLSLLFTGTAYAAPNITYQVNVLPKTTNLYDLGTTTNIWNRIFFNYGSSTAFSATTICLTGDTCRTTWPTGGGGGSANIATSATEVQGQLPFWTTSGGTPAQLATVATTTLTGNNGLTLSAGSGALVGGSNATIGLATINAGVLGAVTNGSVPTSQATSSLYGAVQNGKILAGTGGKLDYVSTTTFSTGLTFSAGNVTCDTASASVFGCLTSANWTTFNNKQAPGFQIATTSTIAVPQLAYFTNTGTTLGGVATNTLTASGVVQVTNSPVILGGSSAAITVVGGSNGQILGWSGGVPTWGATSTDSCTTVTCSYADGVNTFSIAAGAIALSKLANQNANTVLVNQTGSSGAPTALATSTFGNTLYGTGTGGQVLYMQTNGTPTWAATTTAGTGLTWNAGNNFSVNTSQNIATLSNLTSNGYVKTSGGVGTLGVQAVPIPIADGGTNATSLTTSGNVLYYDGTREATALTTAAATLPYASSTAMSATGPIYAGTTNSNFLSVGSTTPWGLLAINPTAGVASNEFVVGSSTATAFIVNNEGRVGIGTTSPSFNSALDVLGTTTIYGNVYAGASVCKGLQTTQGLQVLSYCGNDNNSLRGVQAYAENTNAGANAWVGVDVSNDKANLNVTNFAGMFLNSSFYNDTTFGTAIAKPDLFYVQNSMGGLSLFSSTTTASSSIVMYTSGTTDGVGPTGNERMRINGVGRILVGTTSASSSLLTLASSTEPQLQLGDATAGDNPWTFRGVNSTFYFATSSGGLAPSTSTTNIFSVNSNNTVAFGNSITLAKPLVETSGGTNQNAVATGDLLYGSGTNTWARRAATTNGFILALSGGLPTWVASTSITASSGGVNTNLQYNNGGSMGGVASTNFGSAGGWETIGTSTASSTLLTLGTSTAPQLALSDNNGSSLWTVRNAGGILYVATSSGSLAPATSTLPSFTINANGHTSIMTNTQSEFFNLGGNLEMVSKGQLLDWADQNDAIRVDDSPSWSNSNNNSMTFQVFSSGSDGRFFFTDHNHNVTETIDAANTRVGIGTTSPWAALSIVSSATPFVIASSTAANSQNALFEIDKNQHLIVGGPAPSVSTCGTSPTVTANSTDVAGQIKMGTGALSACTVTFANAYTTNAPFCFVNLNITAATATVIVASTSLTNFIVNASASNLGGSRLQYHCIANSPQ